MYIAVDFDGTLVTNEFPNIGDRVPFAVETLKYLVEKGHKVILHTCRTHDIHEGHDCLAEAVQWCKDSGIELYAVNDNPYAREHWGNKKERDTFINKVYADVYIDDHSLFMPMINGHVNWYKVFNHFKALHGELNDPHDVTVYAKS